MMKARFYDYYEEFDSYVTIVEGENSSIKELSEILYEEKVILPFYDEKIRLKDSKKYRLIIEERRHSSYFWISENKIEEKEQEDGADVRLEADFTHLAEKREGELKDILKAIRRVHY